MFVYESGIIFVVGFWFSLSAVDFILKKSRKRIAYLEWLDKYGISISSFHMRWKTTVFNRRLIRIGHSYPRFFLVWFTLGAMFGMIAMIGSIFLLTGMLIKSIKKPNEEQILQPIMPGLNMPWEEVSFYILTLIIAGLFHEAGHAIAAARENVRINSFGIFVLFLYPGAFVELHSDQFEILQPMKKLRILTAGVWHNMVLALLAVSGLYLLPYFVWPFYHINSGVLVSWIDPQSSIEQILPIGDVITGINSCQIQNSEDWQECLKKYSINIAEGYCNSKLYVKMHNTSLAYLKRTSHNDLDCCNETTLYRFCFSYHVTKAKFINSTSSKLDLPRMVKILHRTTEHACLPARQSIQKRDTCLRNSDCIERYQQMLCMTPLTSNSSKIIQIKRSKGQNILFVGNPMELLSAVAISNYVPRYSLLFSKLPDHLRTMFYYLISISSALAILNMVPCIFLDGHQTLYAILEIYIPRNHTLRNYLSFFILIFGSGLLMINILIACISLFTSS